jgi:quercetin dioxygenase-like cupin family protein
VLPEDIDWQPFPAFPPSARLAVVVGDTAEPAPYVVRVKLPAGVKLMPHRHHEDRVYTVMSGVFYIGVGEQFDDGKLQAYPPGAVIVLPGGTPHFHWSKSGQYVTQVTAIGPISLDYVDAADDRAEQVSHIRFAICRPADGSPCDLWVIELTPRQRHAKHRDAASVIARIARGHPVEKGQRTV